MASMEEAEFRELCEVGLGENFDQALRLFHSCGKNIGSDVASVLLYAIDNGGVAEVLDSLAAHYESVLQHQHPDVRGTLVVGSTNPTRVFFERIYTEILGLQPAHP